MILLRSALFNLLFFLVTPVFSLLVLFSRPFGFSVSWFWARAWSSLTRGLLRLCCGIRIRIEGREHLPDEPCVVIGKHQSALETIMMPLLVPPYTWVLKRELLHIPFFGWALMALGTIAIRRSSPRDALKQVLVQGRRFLEQGRWIVIFPEGTRTPVGKTGRYQPGGIVLAQKAGVGLLPLAHNAGRCWPRKGFMKYPGTVTLRFLPFIPPDQVASTPRDELLSRIRDQIEQETRRLGG